MASRVPPPPPPPPPPKQSPSFNGPPPPPPNAASMPNQANQNIMSLDAQQRIAQGLDLLKGAIQDSMKKQTYSVPNYSGPFYY
ncbi:hypothetical protein Ciccas_006759 [Cichlidogyrus casuarinus]|uniref:Uncharacterized protein n=1 Tax=Cichlidogyrus casuarinus TaxID=1844966 RepID=A0ABD2Q4U6_9PLAT